MKYFEKKNDETIERLNEIKKTKKKLKKKFNDLINRRNLNMKRVKNIEIELILIHENHERLKNQESQLYFQLVSQKKTIDKFKLEDKILIVLKNYAMTREKENKI